MKDKLYYSTIAFYQDQRGLNDVSLAKACGISRPTITDVSNGIKRIKKKENLEKLAAALAVEEQDLIFCTDPLAVRDKVVDITAITKEILSDLFSLHPQIQRKKAARASAYLLLENPELEKCIRYLLVDSTPLARTFLSRKLPNCSDQEAEDTAPVPLKPFSTALDFYRNQRGISKTKLSRSTNLVRETELPHLAKIEYHVLIKLCKGAEKPTPEQLKTLAKALAVDYNDLIRDLCPDSPQRLPLVDMEREAEKIRKAVARCKPRLLKEKKDPLHKYLLNSEYDIEPLMDSLLFSPPSRHAEIIKCFRLLMSFPWAHSSKMKNELETLIGYCKSEGEEHTYEVFVLFNDYVYELFNLDSPKSPIHYPDTIDSSSLPKYGITSQFYTVIDIPPEDRQQFESELLDQIIQYFLQYETEGMAPWLFDIFYEYLYENLSTAFITEYTAENLDKTLPFRIHKRKEQYNRLFAIIQKQTESHSHFQREIIEILSQMREDPKYEQQILKQYHLSDL